MTKQERETQIEEIRTVAAMVIPAVAATIFVGRRAGILVDPHPPGLGQDIVGIEHGLHVMVEQFIKTLRESAEAAG